MRVDDSYSTRFRLIDHQLSWTIMDYHTLGRVFCVCQPEMLRERLIARKFEQ